MSKYASRVDFYFNSIISLAQFGLIHLTLINHAIESIMFRMVHWYDLYMYTPLQIILSPSMARIPRSIQIGNKSVTVFNANIVTYSRTLLIIPIAWCLKYNYSMLSCFLVFFHDFLDNVDGIVAKVQKRVYGENIDDPLYGGFIDAFCDKIVNIFCLWTILQETHFECTSFWISSAFILLCYTIITLETVIGVVRVQDYFSATLNENNLLKRSSTSATMEGKLKETLESTGLAFLCLSTGHIDPFHHWSGLAGIICFMLTIRLAYASLKTKLDARNTKQRKKSVRIDLTSSDQSQILETIIRESEEETRHDIQRSLSLPSIWIDARADKVFTVGCFDLFHEGHQVLLERMRQFGRQVIVGVHDSRSIYKLKSRVPVHGTETRMNNVKRYADQVYCIAGTDPSSFVTCIVHLGQNETAVYVRGDDMEHFPSRHVVEQLMRVTFLPYTNGVSSTKLRQEFFSHIQPDDIEHLEKVN